MDVRIICISDIERAYRGSSMDEELSVYHGTGATDIFGLKDKTAFYFRAYSYMLVLYGKAKMNIDQHGYVLTPRTLVSQSPLHLAQFEEVSADFEFKVASVTQGMVDSLKHIDVRPRVVEGTRTHARPISIMTAQEASVVEQCFDDLVRCVERVGHRYRRGMVENSLCRFFLEYDNIFSNREEADAQTQSRSPRQQQIVDKFIDLVSTDMPAHTNVAHYCDKMGLTPQYLTRVMRAQTGIRPSDFIREMLYAEARNLLTSHSLTVQEVAFRLGFADQSSFGKFFKRCSGMPPGHFARS